MHPTSDNVNRLLQALDRFGFSSLGLTAADFMQPQAMVQLGYPPARIDLLTAIDGVEFTAFWARRQVFNVTGVALPVLHLDDFRANKRASGRLKDLADLRSLDDPTSAAPGGQSKRQLGLAQDHQALQVFPLRKHQRGRVVAGTFEPAQDGAVDHRVHRGARHDLVEELGADAARA